ncbi:MAG: c-type cytochrome [Actinobacteria bacterium]|nr:c-type cytochrome [Actinomycetota bacterium]
MRRSRWAALIAVVAALVAVGVAYAVLNAQSKAAAAPAESATSAQLEEGRKLFLEGCSSCHGLNAEGIDGATVNNGGNGGPSLIGVGSASVHFQVSTGRMPLAGPAAQAPVKTVEYTAEETEALAAYIASLAPGPASPSEEELDFSEADVAEGGELFRTNCSQCHNFAGRGGALSDGAYAPSILDATPQQIYEAMLTGPQQMPVFSNESLTVEEKQAILAYVDDLRTAPNPAGQDLGSLGPVGDGLFAWLVGIVLFVAVAVWIGARVR